MGCKGCCGNSYAYEKMFQFIAFHIYWPNMRSIGRLFCWRFVIIVPHPSQWKSKIWRCWSLLERSNKVTLANLECKHVFCCFLSDDLRSFASNVPALLSLVIPSCWGVRPRSCTPGQDFLSHEEYDTAVRKDAWRSQAEGRNPRIQSRYIHVRIHRIYTW